MSLQHSIEISQTVTAHIKHTDVSFYWMCVCVCVCVCVITWILHVFTAVLYMFTLSSSRWQSVMLKGYMALVLFWKLLNSFMQNWNEQKKKNKAFYSCLYILCNKNKLCIYCHSACNDKITTIQIVIMLLYDPDYKGERRLKKHNIWDSTFNLRI